MKIKDALNMIHIEPLKDNLGCKWYVPNRKQLNMSFDEFVEFERQRLLEFQTKKSTKYFYHYSTQITGEQLSLL